MPLFSTAGSQPFRNDRNYTVVPGEERFIFLRSPETVELVVVTDWFDRVREIFGIEE